MLDHPSHTSDVHEYLKKIISYLQQSGLLDRLQSFMCYLLTNKMAHITQAFLEELELLTSIVS